MATLNVDFDNVLSVTHFSSKDTITIDCTGSNRKRTFVHLLAKTLDDHGNSLSEGARNNILLLLINGSLSFALLEDIANGPAKDPIGPAEALEVFDPLPLLIGCFYQMDDSLGAAMA